MSDPGQDSLTKLITISAALISFLLTTLTGFLGQLLDDPVLWRVSGGVAVLLFLFLGLLLVGLICKSGWVDLLKGAGITLAIIVCLYLAVKSYNFGASQAKKLEQTPTQEPEPTESVAVASPTDTPATPTAVTSTPTWTPTTPVSFCTVDLDLGPDEAAAAYWTALRDEEYETAWCLLSKQYHERYPTTLEEFIAEKQKVPCVVQPKKQGIREQSGPNAEVWVRLENVPNQRGCGTWSYTYAHSMVFDPSYGWQIYDVYEG